MSSNPEKPLEWAVFNEPMGYSPVLEAMEARVEAIAAGTAPEAVWLLEHPPLYTGGTSATPQGLLAPQFPTYNTGRGGQWTYHGPGQRVGYVMLDLKRRDEMDVRAYVQKLEQWIIATLARFNVPAFTREGRIGVWVETPQGREAKIAALGIRMRKWITYHGISINVAPDLSHYAGIVPCGIEEYGVTSLTALGVKATMEEVDAALRQEFERIF